MYNITIRAYNTTFKRAGGYDGGYHTPANISDDKISDIYGARTRYKMENGGYIAFSINELKQRLADKSSLKNIERCLDPSARKAFNEAKDKAKELLTKSPIRRHF